MRIHRLVTAVFLFLVLVVIERPSLQTVACPESADVQYVCNQATWLDHGLRESVDASAIDADN
jgi:hypothetical protein